MQSAGLVLANRLYANAEKDGMTIARDAAACRSERSQCAIRSAEDGLARQRVILRACESFDFFNFGMSKINDLRGQNPKKSN
jgi:hypothetical protein